MSGERKKTGLYAFLSCPWVAVVCTLYLVTPGKHVSTFVFFVGLAHLVSLEVHVRDLLQTAPSVKIGAHFLSYLVIFLYFCLFSVAKLNLPPVAVCPFKTR